MNVRNRAVEDCIEAAAQYLAHEPDAVVRALHHHTPAGDGRCRGCGHRGITWPCAVASSAKRALQILYERGDPRSPATDPSNSVGSARADLAQAAPPSR